MTPRPTLIPFLFAALLLALCAQDAAAQVRVDISFKRKLYVMYEPLIAVVTVHNLSGRPLLLDNTSEHRWLTFNIESADGRIIPPNNPDYAFPPAAIEPGEKLPAAFNLTPLFPLQEFGLYRVRAAVYVPEFGRFFSSPPLAVEITDGRPIWQEVVGVPGGDGKAPELRTITLLSQALAQHAPVCAHRGPRERPHLRDPPTRTVPHLRSARGRSRRGQRNPHPAEQRAQAVPLHPLESRRPGHRPPILR